MLGIQLELQEFLGNFESNLINDIIQYINVAGNQLNFDINYQEVLKSAEVILISHSL